MENATATIAAGDSVGWLSLAVPAALPPGPYTFAIQAETETTFNNTKTQIVTFSNPITIRVETGPDSRDDRPANSP